MGEKLTVIMPAYNEGAHIDGILEKVCRVKLPYECKMQLIVINDGSKDNTSEVVKSFISKYPDRDVVLLEHPTNQGKGMAIRTGLSVASGDYLVIQDGDEELDPNDFVAMLMKMIDEDLSVLYGSRFLERSQKVYVYKSFYIGSCVLSTITNLLYFQHITDEPTCYKMFRTELLKSLQLKCTGFEFCPEVTAKVCRKGYNIKEIPIHYYPRTMEEGKKIRSRDGWIALWTLIKYRFVPKRKL